MKRVFSIIYLVFIGLFFSTALFSQTEYRTFTYPNGQISSEGLLRDGKPDGLWKTYYESGQLKSIGKRTDFLLDSTWVFLKENGDTSLVVNYKKDLKNGLRFTYSETDVMIEPFVNDVRQGEGKKIDKKGRLLQSMNLVNGLEEGISPIFDTTGLLREIVTYRKGFVMAREALNRYDLDGKKHGYWKTFFDDWSVHTECYYRHGLRDGFYKEYDEKGNLKKITKYANDV